MESEKPNQSYKEMTQTERQAYFNNKDQQCKKKQAQIQNLRKELAQMRQGHDHAIKVRQSDNSQEAKFFEDSTGQFIDTFEALKFYLPENEFENIRQILYGIKCQQVEMSKETQETAKDKNVEVKQFRIQAQQIEELREPRRVKIAAIQNKIVLPTTAPVKQQKQALMNRIGQMIEIAALEKANIICLQQIWTAPFFMCTREKYPWVEFSEPIDGESTQFLSKLAKKYNMVIVSSILERDPLRGTLHNTAVVIDNEGDILGKQVKGHIPRVGDFNQSSYYMEGQSGHPVFETAFGKLGINICYGRHHPLHWMGFALNGAQIIFNPSATINGLSEPLWAIEGRNAAIANHCFTVNINRVGTEQYPHPFTSGDRKDAKTKFGHFYGSSYVAAPDGSRTPSLSRTNDGILFTQIDLNHCLQIKDTWQFTMTGRHKIYADLLTHYISNDFKPQTIKKVTSEKS